MVSRGCTLTELQGGGSKPCVEGLVQALYDVNTLGIHGCHEGLCTSSSSMDWLHMNMCQRDVVKNAAYRLRRLETGSSAENKYVVAIIVAFVRFVFDLDRDLRHYYYVCCSASTTIYELRHDQTPIQVPNQQEHLDVRCTEYQSSDDCEQQS